MSFLSLAFRQTKNPRLTGNRGFVRKLYIWSLEDSLYVAVGLLAQMPDLQARHDALRARAISGDERFVHIRAGYENGIGGNCQACF